MATIRIVLANSIAGRILLVNSRGPISNIDCHAHAKSKGWIGRSAGDVNFGARRRIYLASSKPPSHRYGAPRRLLDPPRVDLRMLPIGQGVCPNVSSPMIKSTQLLIASLFCVSSLRAQPASKVEKNPPPLDPKNMDTSVKPQDDFFMYANGSWIKRTEIPPEYSRWGSFNQLIEQNNDALHAIAERAAKTKADPKTAPELQKVGDYYASGMDEKTIEAMRTKPLQDELGKIDMMKDRQDVLKEIAHLHTSGVNALFNFGSGQDDKDSTREISQAVQGGLGMPDRDYYTKTDDDSKKLRDKYVEHVTKMLTLLGEPATKAGEDAKKILALETSLAQASRTRVELRDPQKNYNKMTQAELQALTPDWNWADYFKGIDLAAPGDIDVHQPDFFKAVNTVFTSTSIDDWKTYLRWHLINATAAELSKDFVNEDFNFKETTLRGTKEIKPRWKRVVISTDGEIGEALGNFTWSIIFRRRRKRARWTSSTI